MLNVPREAFVPQELIPQSYEDFPLPIGCDQTISQPYIVAKMTEMLALHPGMKVLEIGTGSGYQTAILAYLGCNVFTIEIIPQLAENAKTTLNRYGFSGIHFRMGDAFDGWPEAAPFDRIILTAAPPSLPSMLINQAIDGGRIVGPVGVDEQWLNLWLVHKKGRLESCERIPVRFVPMTGKAFARANPSL